MSDVNDFFSFRNTVHNISNDEQEQTANYLETIDAFARTTYKSIYVIDYQKKGFEIVIFTARNMNTHKGDIRKIKSLTLPIIEKWLHQNDVPYDEIIIGKPWCGFDGFYIDDKSIRPDEFISFSEEEIKKIIN